MVLTLAAGVIISPTAQREIIQRIIKKCEAGRAVATAVVTALPLPASGGVIVHIYLPIMAALVGTRACLTTSLKEMAHSPDVTFAPHRSSVVSAVNGARRSLGGISLSTTATPVVTCRTGRPFPRLGCL